MGPKSAPGDIYFKTQDGQAKIRSALRDHLIKRNEVGFKKKDFKKELVGKL